MWILVDYSGFMVDQAGIMLIYLHYSGSVVNYVGFMILKPRGDTEWKYATGNGRQHSTLRGRRGESGPPPAPTPRSREPFYP